MKKHRTTSEPLGTSAELLARYQQGSEDAADAIFARYIERLTRLARSRLSNRLATRTDPEDIVLSAWRSFFISARAGRYSLQRSGDLWRLLASITMHKLYRQIRHQTADKRSVHSEQPLDHRQTELEPSRASEPTPEEAIALADELEVVMSQLDKSGRKVLELRLQGESLTTIATETGRSERTIRRLLGNIRKLLTGRLEAEQDD